MVGELEPTGLKALMDLSSWRGPVSEYLKSLEAAIAANKTLDKTVKEQAAALKVTEKEINRGAASLAKLEAATAKTKREAESLEKQLRAQTESMGRFYASFGRNLQQFGRQMSMFVTVPLVAAAGASVKFAVDFESKMAAIQSIGRQTTAELGTLGDELLAMSTDLSQTSASATELADVFYFLQGSGFAGRDAMEVLEVAAKASQAGMAGLQESTDALVFSLNAYGVGAEEAQRFSDTLFRTVDLGIVGYEDLSGAIGLVTGQSAASGLSFVELNTAIATISRTTKGAGRIAREFNMFLTTMNKPTKELNKLFLEATGHTAAWMLRNEGLAATLRVVADATGGSAEKINALFGNVRAGRAVMSLMRGDLADFNELLVGIGDSAGATAEAAAINIDTTAAALTNLKNVSIAAGIKLAESYLPAIQKLTEMLAELTEKIGNLTDAQKTLLLVFGGFAALMGPLLSGLGMLLEMGGNLTIMAVKQGTTLGGLIASFAGPAGLIVAILALGAALKILGDESLKQLEQYKAMRHEVALTAQSYSEYAKTVKEETPFLVQLQQNQMLIMSNGMVNLRKEMMDTEEEFLNFRTILASLSSHTQEFSDSLDEGNLSLKTLRELAYDAKIAIGDMSIEAAKYASQWRENKDVIEIPEELATAWKEASDKITKIMQELPDILEENEAELNKIVKEYEKERIELRTTAASKQKTLLGEHQAELAALDKAYAAKRLELEANNDAAGIVALDKAYQKKRNKMLMDYRQDELDLGATNQRKQLELDRAHLEDLIEQRKANKLSLEEQRKKLGLEVWQASAAAILKDGVVDKGEQDIIDTLEKNFGIQLDNQIKYNLDSLALTKALADGNLGYAKIIADGWKALSEEQGGAADDLQAQLDAMPTPEDIMNQFDFTGVFDAVGGAAASATSSVSEVDSATASLSKTVKDVATAIEEAITAFESLAGYETDPRLRTALTNIAEDIRDAVTIFVRTWAEREDKVTGEAKHAAKFAARATTVMEAYRTAAEAFKAAAEYSKVSANTLGDIADNIIMAVRHMAAISDIWEPEYIQEVALFAQQVSVILGPFATMADVAKATVDYSKVANESIHDIADNINTMLRHFEWLYNNTPEIERDALVFAEAISLITGAMGNAAESLSKLGEYSKVSEYRMKDFISDLDRLVDLFEVPEIGEDMLEKAKAFAAFMKPVADTVKDGTDALTVLSTYSSQAVEGVEDFVDDLEELAMRMLIRVPWFGESSIAKLKAFAAAIAPVSSIVSDGIKGLIGLRDYSSEAIEGAEDFVDDIEELTYRILVRVPWMGQSVVDKLTAFAETIKPTAEIVSSGMEILSSLSDYTAATLPDVFSFMRDLRSIVNEIAAQAKPYGIDITDNLTDFYKAVKPSADIVKDGLDILSTIKDYTPGTEADVFSFMRDLRSMVYAISAQAKPYGKEIVDNLIAFAEAIKPSAEIVGDGLDILNGLQEISAPTAENIQDFLDSLVLILGMLEDQLPPTSTDLIDELTAFAEAMGPASEIITSGVDALVALEEEYIVAPAEAAVISFIAALKELLRLLEENLPSISAETITVVSDFAKAIAPISDIIDKGNIALNNIGRAEREKPSKIAVISLITALEEVLDIMEANLPVISRELINVITKFADAVKPAASIIDKGIKALEDIAEYEPTTKDINAKVVLLVNDLIELKDALKNNLPTFSAELIKTITDFKDSIEVIAGMMKSATDLLEQMAGLKDLPGLKKNLGLWSATIVDSLDTLMESLNGFLEKHPEITAAEFYAKAVEITDDLNDALALLTGYNAKEATGITEIGLMGSNATGFARLANAIHEMSLSAILDLGNMSSAIRYIISAIAAIPRTVIVKFISDSSGFAPPGIPDSGFPSYDKGGIVPGPIGKPQLAIVHGGEVIVPPATQTQYNTMTNTTSFNVEAHYARHQSEASVRDDLALMQLMYETG